MSYIIQTEELSNAYAVYKVGPLLVSASLVVPIFTNNLHRGRFYPEDVYVFFNNITNPASDRCTLNIGYTTTGGDAPNIGYNDWVYGQTLGGSTPNFKTDYVQLVTMVGPSAEAGVPNRRKSLAEQNTVYAKIGSVTGSPMTITINISGYHTGLYNPVSGSVFLQSWTQSSTTIDIYNDAPIDAIQTKIR